MKLSVAIFPLAILCSGCTTVKVMRPDIAAPQVNEVQHQEMLPPEQPVQEEEPVKEDEESPCLEEMKELAGQALDSATEAYQEASESEYVDDAKELAKDAGKFIHKKMTEYHEVVKEAIK